MEDRGNSPVLHFPRAIVLVLAEFPDQREQRHVHGNDHSADNDTEEDDHDGFKCGQEVFNRRVHFILVEVRNLLQHGIHCAGLFTDGDHLGDHARENRTLFQGFCQRFAFFEGFAHLEQRLFHNRVTRRSRGNVQPFQNRHTGRNQGAQRPREPRHGNLAHQYAKYRQLQNYAVQEISSPGRSVPDLHPEDACDDRNHDQQPEDAANEIAQTNDDFRRQRQIDTQSREQRRENRNHLPEQKDDDGRGDAYNTDRVNQRRLNRRLQFHVLLNIGRKPLQNGVENTARLPRLHHVAVERVKHLRILFHRRGQVAATFNRGARSRQHLLKQFVLLLAGQNFQALHQRKTGFGHHRELAGEHREFLGADAAAERGHVEFLALFGHLRRRDLLAPQQTLQLRLAGSRHFPGNGPSRPIRSSISKDRHNLSSSTAKNFALPSPEKLSLNVLSPPDCARLELSPLIPLAKPPLG